MGGGGGGFGNLLKGKPFHVGGLRAQTSPSLSLQPRLRPHFVGIPLFAFFVCKLYHSAKLIQHYSTICNTTLLRDVEQGGQTNSILLITPENIEKVESTLQITVPKLGISQSEALFTVMIFYDIKSLT